MKKHLSTKALEKFAREYALVFPCESQVDIRLIKLFRITAHVCIETKLNLIYVKKFKDRYEIVAHWCLANKDYTPKKNAKAFREVLDFARKQDMPVVISNLNKEYYKATVPYSKEYRQF